MNQKQKRVKMPAVAGSRTKNTYSLSSQCSATEPWQLNDHEPSICPAQVALNASVAHLAATASLFILLYFRLITSKFIYFQHEARCSELCCMHIWQSKCQWEYSELCVSDLICNTVKSHTDEKYRKSICIPACTTIEKLRF